jgi:hypothetical protein
VSRLVDPAIQFDLFGSPPDSMEHIPEDESVEGQDGVPVEDSEQTLWLESSDLIELASTSESRDRFDTELQHSFPGDLHLGSKFHPAVTLEPCHSPEIEGVAMPDHFRVAPATAQSRASEKTVDEPTESPKGIRRIPAVLPTDAANGPKHFRGRCGHLGLFTVLESRATGPVRVPWDCPCIGPGGLDIALLLLSECLIDGLPYSEESLGHEALRGVITADDAIAQALGEWAGDLVAQGSHEVNPERAQPGR